MAASCGSFMYAQVLVYTFFCRGTDYAVDVILHSGSLAAYQEMIVDTPLEYLAVFAGGVHEQYQVLALAITVHGVAAAHGLLDGRLQTLREFF